MVIYSYRFYSLKCIITKYSIFSPFLQKKKTEKVPQINNAFVDFDEYEMFEEVGEAAHAEVNAPVPSENPEEENKRNTLFKNEMDCNDRSDECLQIPPEANVILDSPLPTNVLDEESSCDIGMTSKSVGLNTDVKQICTESFGMSIGNNNTKEELFPSKDLCNKNESVNRLTTQQPKFYKDYNEMLKDIRKNSVADIGQILRRNLGMTSKIVGLNKDVKQIHTENVEMSVENDIIKEELMPPRNLDKKTEGVDILTTQQLQLCEDYNEKLKDIRQISVDEIEVLGRSSNPDNNYEFEVDFEAAFGPSMKTSDCEDPWPPIH